VLIATPQWRAMSLIFVIVFSGVPLSGFEAANKRKRFVFLIVYGRCFERRGAVGESINKIHAGAFFVETLLETILETFPELANTLYPTKLSLSTKI
jgi:hypothetical protein